VDFRADDHRAFQGQRLDDVVRAVGGETAAGDDAVGEGDVEIHLAEAVAEEAVIEALETGADEDVAAAAEALAVAAEAEVVAEEAVIVADIADEVAVEAVEEAIEVAEAAADEASA